jgi:hypothetical protein
LTSFFGFHADARSQGFDFRQVYYQQDEDKVFPMKLIKNGQMKLEFFEQPKGPHFAAVVTHPLKRAEDFYRFHKQACCAS